MDILVLASVPRGILREEEPEPFDGRGFRGPSITIFYASEVISHKDPAGFTIEALIVLPSFGRISRCLTGKGKIDGQSLVWDSGCPNGLMTRGCLCCFVWIQVGQADNTGDSLLNFGTPAMDL